MDAKDLLLAQHAIVHAAAVSGAKGPTLADRTFANLTDAQMRLRPAPNTNSLAWLLWHVARTEDLFVNVIFTPERQVYDDGWRKRLNVALLDIGTGNTADEVAALSDGVDLDVLREYRDQVGRRSRDVIQRLSDSGWEGRVEASDMQRAADSGALGRVAAGLTQIFTGRPRSGMLGTLATIHTAEHIGEALTVRGLGGFGLGV